MRKNKIRHTGSVLLSVLLVGMAIYCVVLHSIGTEMDLPFNVIAAEFTMPTGNAEYSECKDSESETDSKQVVSTVSEVLQETSDENFAEISNQNVQFQESSASDEEIKKYNKENEGKEQYPINEITITQGNESYKNVQVKNLSSIDIDIKSELNSELGFTIEDTDEPQVLIYHTHTCESFLKYDTGYFYEGFYPRTNDNNSNICAVGDEIVKKLNAEGISAIHDKTQHDNPSYSGAYDRSLETINSYLEKYPSIKVVLDIHRDGIGSDTQKSKPVFNVNGKKAAQIMILSGYEYDKSLEFEDWRYNLRFALKIQETASEMYPGMVRPLYFADFVYNMNVNTGSLLIEVGSDSNTLEEVRYSGYLLGEVLAKVLNDNKGE